MRTETVVRLVVEPPDRGVFDGAVHPFDLAVGRWVVEFREAMLDRVLGTGQVEGMGTKRLMMRQQFLNLPDTPATARRRELEAVVPSETQVMTRNASLDWVCHNSVMCGNF